MEPIFADSDAGLRVTPIFALGTCTCATSACGTAVSCDAACAAAQAGFAKCRAFDAWKPCCCRISQLICHVACFKTCTCMPQALSPVGRCKSFDASGDGYGRGEAFTIALLRCATPLLLMWILSCFASFICVGMCLRQPGCCTKPVMENVENGSAAQLNGSDWKPLKSRFI